MNNQPKPLYFRDGKRKIDYILAYQEQPEKPPDWREKRREKREHFEKNLKERGLELEQEDFEVRMTLMYAFTGFAGAWSENFLMSEMRTTRFQNPEKHTIVFIECLYYITALCRHLWMLRPSTLKFMPLGMS